MEPISIVIPVRIESQERENNLRCTIEYLLQSVFVHIDILEADKEQQFYFAPHERIQVLLNTCKMSKSELKYALKNCIGIFSYLTK